MMEVGTAPRKLRRLEDRCFPLCVVQLELRCLSLGCRADLIDEAARDALLPAGLFYGWIEIGG
jgi:hypothetical protein